LILHHTDLLKNLYFVISAIENFHVGGKTINDLSFEASEDSDDAVKLSRPKKSDSEPKNKQTNKSSGASVTDENNSETFTNSVSGANSKPSRLIYIVI
jgi:hypothetical protein